MKKVLIMVLNMHPNYAFRTWISKHCDKVNPTVYRLNEIDTIEALKKQLKEDNQTASFDYFVSLLIEGNVIAVKDAD